MRKNSSQSNQSSQSQSESQSPQLNHLAPESDHSQHPINQSQPSSTVRNTIKLQPQPQQPQPINTQSQITMPLLPNPHQPRLHLPQSQSRPRLIIDRIVLQNFKSYADTQTIGPFHENFTSVVGPNGSGKSNLIESMLFIFGYKANWMRLNRLNQLIHNSSTMQAIDRASVTVHFKKIHESQPIPSSQFSLRRTVRSTGTSKYYINQKQSTQAQVKQCLQAQGIDLNNNRFLILQGQVQQISQMKQKSGDREKPGLLEYLQDIIGSSVYIGEIEDAVGEYGRVEEVKHEKGELMKLAQVELRNMNKGKQQAIKYVKKQRQIYQIHNILHQVQLSNTSHALSQTQTKLSQCTAQCDRIISQQKQKLKKQAQRIRQIKKIHTQIQTIQKHLHQQNQQMNKLSTNDKNINQQLGFKSQDLVKYQKKGEMYDAELGKMIGESREVKEELPGRKERLGGLAEEIRAMEGELAMFDKPQVKQKMKALQTQIKKIQHQLKTYQQKQKSVQKSLQSSTKSSQKSSISQLQLQKKLSQQSQTLQKITLAQTQATKISQSLSTQLQTISQNRKTLLNQLQKISLTLKERQNQKYQSGVFNDMFEKIMGEGIEGVVGRLGDLGTVTGKDIEEIITSSCGRLDNIVVRDMNAATAVLNFLKTNKLGRVTCIILDKIQEQKKYMQRAYQTPPNSIRLFDTITPVSQQCRLAFYFALSDTLYVQNSQLGLQYSMKDEHNRRRVVSKKPHGGGYIIYELNGLMNGCMARSGGFRVKVRGRIGKGKDGKEEEQVRQLEKEKMEVGDRVRKLEERYSAVKKDYEGVVKDIEQFKRQKRTVSNSISQAKQQLSQLQKQTTKTTKSLQSHQKSLQTQLHSLSSHINTLQKSLHTLTSSLESLESEQRKNETQKILRLRDQYKISKQEYNLLQKDIQKKVAILQTTIKRVQQNKKAKAQIDKKIEMLEKDIKKLTKEREDIEIKATEIFTKIKGNEERIQKLRKSQEQMKVLFEEEEKEVKESKIKIDKARQDVEVLKGKVQECQRGMYQAKEELKKERDTYRQLSATYDFLQDIQSIQFMSMQQLKRTTSTDPKHDTSAILNQSIDSNNTSNKTSKVFPLQRLLQISPFEDLSQQRLDQFLLFTDKLRTMLVTQSQNLKKMSGNNLQIISQFREKFKDYKKKNEEFEAVRNAQMELKRKIQVLKEKRLSLFREGFGIINSKLKQVYQLLTRGGDAELQLIDSLDPFSDGINFSVRPPKKAWKQITKLSGGQKTLSSLSLIFALHYYKPTPLYFMDQIDAALDFKNVSIVADYIKKRTKDAQFIIISLRNNMFQLADKLVGVYKTYDKTKIVHFVPERNKRNWEKENVDQNQKEGNRIGNRE